MVAIVVGERKRIKQRSEGMRNRLVRGVMWRANCVCE